jgi:prepilin peptidase CpaA
MIALLLLFSAACAYTDLRSREIPNALTVSGALAGFVYHGWRAGWAGLGFAAVGFGAAFGIYLIFFLLKGRGGGDVKMMAALGAILGWNDWLLLFVLTSVLGGVVALIVVVSRGRVKETGKNLLNLGQQKLGGPRALALPHGPVVAVAALFTAIAINGR